MIEPKTHHANIVEALRARAESYRSGGPSSEHTAYILDRAANEIERLRAILVECCEYIEDDEIAHGRTYRAGRAARAELGRKPPAELEECSD